MSLSSLPLLIIAVPCGLLSILTSLRFLMQLNRVDFYNRVVRSVCNASDPLCEPLRRFIPYNARFDFASLLMSLVLQGLGLYLIYLVGALPSPALQQLLFWALLIQVGLFLRIYFISLLLYVVFSWVRPAGFDSAAVLVTQLIYPLMRPLHRLIPPLGGLDFSPMALFFLIYTLESFWRSFALSNRVPLQLVIGV